MKNLSLEVLGHACAKDAHVNNFPSRRGVYAVTGEKVPLVCVYNNNPYPNAPARRDDEMRALTARLDELGIPVAAKGVYPVAGEDAGYTEALLFIASEADVPAVAEIFEEVTHASGLRSTGPVSSPEPQHATNCCARIIPGRAYVLTADVYQTARIDGGPLVRVFREGDRFVGTSYCGQPELHPVEPNLRVPADPDEAAKRLISFIENNEPLPGAVRDSTWARMANMVVEAPHDQSSLKVLEQCRLWEEEERQEWEEEERRQAESGKLIWA